MSTSGLAQVGIGAPAPAAIGDAVANPSTVDVAALQLAYNGTTWDRRRLPVVVRSANVGAAGSTAVWTPAAGKKFRLQRFLIGASANGALAVAGTQVVQLLDGAGNLNLQVDLGMPAASSGAAGISSTGWVDLGQGVLSVAANNVLNINLSTAMNAGVVVAIVAGTEE